ncbi:hypothetical protein DSOL_0264 [Desulfosporosinus metallidurans]|uniref:Uncharacterized protein n=1 Tax=Desulfosporosinus metallidurans TaxID=1888891 RepID=A0A1Q8R377_9FIRM|nr:hypothetical protein DSOL_0264 [Desulfosporosinus metallidurans]
MLEKFVPFALPFPNVTDVLTFIIHIFGLEFQHFFLAKIFE